MDFARQWALCRCLAQFKEASLRTCQMLAVAVLTLVAAGCSSGSLSDGLSEPPTGRVFGGPSADRLFAPFQGGWHFEDRTFDPELRQIAISGGPDITVTGHIIRFESGLLVREIRLCQAIATADGIECEGWHHEDIHDPGDMQRVACKLRRVGKNLELRWRLLPSADFSDDPVIADPLVTSPDRLTKTSASSETNPWSIESYSPKPAN